MKLEEYKAALNKCIGRYDSYVTQKAQLEKQRDDANTLLKNIELTQALIQNVSQETQSQLKYSLEDIVNSLLQTCFPDDYEFHIDFEIKRGRTEATIALFKNGYEVQPKGGIADIISLGLRIAVWNIGNSRNVLCLDESLKWLSADLQPMAGEILKEISHKLKLQVIMPSHIVPLLNMADQVYTVKNINGVSQVS